jgi:hypothetical protein
MDQVPLGGGGPGDHYPAAFEESRARADERRLDRSREGLSDIDPRARTVGTLFLAAVVVAVMTYAIWDGMGAVAGIVAGVVLTLGGLALWRFWR